MESVVDGLVTVSIPTTPVGPDVLLYMIVVDPWVTGTCILRRICLTISDWMSSTRDGI
jgi:hypothetical protein